MSINVCGGIKMGLKGLFKEQEYKNRINELTCELDSLKNTFTPEMTNIVNQKKLLEDLKVEMKNTEDSLHAVLNELSKAKSELSQKKSQIIETDEEILVQEFGIYSPRYAFENSTEYKSKLEKVRKSQKEMIKAGTAANGNMNWTVNNSASKGRTMVKNMQKLLLRSFNSECDSIVEKVKYNNFDASLKRITSSCDAVSKLGTMMGISISSQYYKLKKDELTLAFEYQEKKQQEKEEQRAIREAMREEAKLQKEIEAARKQSQKEKEHYTNALEKIELQLLRATTDEEKKELHIKKEELESHLQDVEKAIKDIDYREANKRAGYVYIISNIGSFGENIFKIGMTRRLDPMERVVELGDASVPFGFDVHAMIFTDDAPKLETALHKAFEDKKLNLVNQRREFFNVTLDDIKKVVSENYDKTVEFIDIPDAEQYRVSQKMKKDKR